MLFRTKYIHMICYELNRVLGTYIFEINRHLSLLRKVILQIINFKENIKFCNINITEH